MGQFFLVNQNIRDYWNLIPEQLTLMGRFVFSEKNIQHEQWSLISEQNNNSFFLVNQTI